SGEEASATSSLTLASVSVEDGWSEVPLPASGAKVGPPAAPELVCSSEVSADVSSSAGVVPPVVGLELESRGVVSELSGCVVVASPVGTTGLTLGSEAVSAAASGPPRGPNVGRSPLQPHSAARRYRVGKRVALGKANRTGRQGFMR